MINKFIEFQREVIWFGFIVNWHMSNLMPKSTLWKNSIGTIIPIAEEE